MSNRLKLQGRKHGVHNATHAAIAEAVHEAVCQVTASDGFGLCTLYAWAGSIVASVVTGKDYMVQGGRLTVRTGDVNEDGELLFRQDPETYGATGGEFHAWFTARPSSALPGAVVKVRPSDTFVDLSMRHYLTAIRRLGMPWKRGPLPPYYWGPHSGLRELGVWLESDALVTVQVNEPRDLLPRKETAMLAMKILRGT